MITHPELSVKLDSLKREFLYTLFQWRNSPEIFRWCRQNDLINEVSHNQWYERQSVDPKIRMYLIRAEKDIPVGVCGLTDIDLVNQRAEFSLYIAPNYQRSGYGKQALKLLCYHGFTSYPLRTIWGESFEGNPAIKMFLDIGFKEDGTRRDFYYRDGKYLNARMFSMKRHELCI